MGTMNIGSRTFGPSHYMWCCTTRPTTNFVWATPIRMCSEGGAELGLQLTPNLTRWTIAEAAYNPLGLIGCY
jgi:hypothetical protein